jgi:CelD/BcsL family acetyltransferase involved in cellulose biosynthesis
LTHEDSIVTDSIVALDHPLPRIAARAETAARARIVVEVTSRFADVASFWGRLTRGVELDSPGQSLAFVELWADSLRIAQRDRLFVTATVDGNPVLLLPLYLRRVGPLKMYTWFPGRHVGCNAPVADHARLNAMSADERRQLWGRVALRVSGADLIYLPALPHYDGTPFADLGQSIDGDILYRAEFTGWENADKTQRTKSRRKHDRQQGERLEAMGAVEFRELTNNDDTVPVIATMFRQRAARFAKMGVADPFAPADVRAFYNNAAMPGSPVDVRLHVLRLNGEIVAVRYNVVQGSRMFCLISSMSCDEAVQSGSPGKQNLLRVMQTVFDNGYKSFDMGAGFTDEKRHWCNVQIPVRHHYLPLTATGRAVTFAHRMLKTVRHRVKSNPALLALAKRVRTAMHKPRAQGEE